MIVGIGVALMFVKQRMVKKLMMPVWGIGVKQKVLP